MHKLPIHNFEQISPCVQVIDLEEKLIVVQHKIYVPCK